jgi:hypothetical protein
MNIPATDLRQFAYGKWASFFWSRRNTRPDEAPGYDGAAVRLDQDASTRISIKSIRH